MKQFRMLLCAIMAQKHTKRTAVALD